MRPFVLRQAPVSLNDAHELAVACRHDRRAKVLTLQPLEQFGERNVGADRARSVAHDVLDGQFVVAGQGAAAELSENDPVVVDDDALVPAARSDALAYRAEVVVERAGRNIAVGCISG